jgi:hypothetical protein
MITVVMLLSVSAASMPPAQDTALAFAPPAVCAEAPDRHHCEAASPQDWTAAERRIVEDALNRVLAHDLGRAIVERARTNGYRVLHRYRTDVQRNRSGQYESKFGPGFVLYPAKVIGITDAFFELAELRDARGGYRVGDLVLLHELVHAFDDRQRSIDTGFAALTGWKFEDGRWHYTNRVSYSGYSGVYAETLTLYARGRYDEAWSRDREFATSLPNPLPRLQSLVTPAESFADIVAHLILDPTAREYLAPPVVEWVEKHVFAALRF